MARPRLRLALLAAAVLAVHVGLLVRWRLPAPPAPMPGAMRFETRSVAAAPSPASTADFKPKVAGSRSGIARAAPEKIAKLSQAEAPAAPAELPRATVDAAVALPQAHAGGAAPTSLATAETTAAPPAEAASTGPTGAASVSSGAARLAIPAPVRHRYRVTASVRGFTAEGEGELVFRHDGRQYEAQLELRAPLLRTRTQRSSGHITAEGLAPARFSDRSRSEEAAHFQRDAGQVSFSTNRPAAALEAGAQDRLSVLLQLAALIGGEPSKYPPGSALRLQTAGTRDAAEWEFRIEAQEELVLLGTPQPTLRLSRAPRHEYDQQLVLWLAPGLAYAPVRVRLTSANGDWVEQHWSGADRP
jgi:hypothetical protein